MKSTAMKFKHLKRDRVEPRVPRRWASFTVRHRRGSALFLVAVTLVLMTILGTSYIQLARLDRVATRRFSNGDITAVAKASFRQIQSVLYDDLYDAEGRLFNGTVTDPGGGDEPYDYPWTNQFVNQTVVKRDGSPASVKGGEKDDRWLASTMPDFTTPSKPRWPHITNLNGIFLRVGTTTDPIEDLVDMKVSSREDTYLRTDTTNRDIGDSFDEGLRLLITGADSGTVNAMDADVTNPWGVDSDGDGILDSRWTWAPIRRIGDVSYIMAVRIIDNSSLINANVALSQIGADGEYDTVADAPRWWYPSELNFGQFIRQMGIAASVDYTADLRRQLAYRMGASVPAPLPTPWGNVSEQREHFWLWGPAMYDNYGDPGGEDAAYQSLGITSELDLRYRNGLNNPEEDTTIESDTTGMPLLTRWDKDTEKTFQDFTGGSGTVWQKIQRYFEEEPRHQMTVINGAAIFASPLSNKGDNPPRLKADLNRLLMTPGSLKVLSDQIRQVYNYKNGWPYVSSEGIPANRPINDFSHYATDNPYPEDWTTRDWADQYAVCIADYADEDNWISVIDRTGDSPEGGIVYGLEALPFITEIYAQAEYSTPGDTDDDGSITWTVTGERGYAIEVRNPFRRAIKFTDVHLYVDDEDWGTLDTLVPADPEDFDDPKQEVMEVNEVLILYKDSGTGAGDNVAAMWSGKEDVGTKYILAEIAHEWPDDDETITVELRAKDSDGVVLPWAYADARIDGLADTYTESVAVDPKALTAYGQVSSIGNGNRINAMLIRKSDFARTNQVPSVDGSSSGRSTSIGTLSMADKTADGPKNVVVPNEHQILFRNQGDIVQVGELAHITVLGPNEDNTVADAWHAGDGDFLPEGRPDDVGSFMPVFDTKELMTRHDGAPGTDPSDNRAVPHAVALLDQFTTMSPASDGLDNDGDGKIDVGTGSDNDDDEQFVPGTININTIPARMLRMILPIPDTAVRDHVINAIVKYRDLYYPFADVASPYKPADDTRGGLGSTKPINIAYYRTNPGIAMLGELMEIVHRGDDNELDTLDLMGKDSATAPILGGPDNRTLDGVQVDFNNPTAGGSDGIVNDREEATMIARWLMQTCSTRSDIFTAYVLIKGYPSADFRLGAVESARFFAVFDRSRVTDSADTVRVLGMYRVE